MKRILIYISNKHEEVLKFLLLVIGILTITYMLPKEVKFKYEFQKGKRWQHKSLEAPFDFAVYKSKEELQKEKADIIKNMSPYFIVNRSIAENKILAFAREFESKWNLLDKTDNVFYSEAQKKFQKEKALSVLNAIYNKGIVLLSDEIKNKPQEYSVMLLDNNIAEEVELAKLYTVQSAYDYIELSLNKDSRANKQLLTKLLQNAVAPNIFFDENITKKVYKDFIDNISLMRGMIKKGDKIIFNGEVLDEEKYQIITSLKEEYKNRLGYESERDSVFWGQLILVTISITMLMLFLFLFRRDIFNDNPRIGFLLLLIILMIFIYVWSLEANIFSLYLVPFCIIAIIIRTFFDTRLALFTHLIMILIIGFDAPNGFNFIFPQIIAGMVAVFSIVNMRNRSQLFISGGIIFLAYSLTFIGISIIHEGSIYRIEWGTIKWFIGNALLTLFAYPLIFISEKLFGFISDVSLMELSDSNSKLLRELAFKAPGTFQHSLQVANLAEAAIYRIGGNTLLIRAGALYHDIGKMDNPMYFIENQNTGVNPHDELSFEESAKIIIGHVIAGVEKAKKHKLPEQIIDFIRTHHGTTRVQYFYQSFLKNYPDEIIDEEMFRYNGPIPFSKETAVLMMADSVEAASRSLQKIDAEIIEKLVDNIIDNQIKQNQFINSNITFKDIAIIKKIFKRMLMSVYHVRVEYSPLH